MATSKSTPAPKAVPAPKTTVAPAKTSAASAAALGLSSAAAAKPVVTPAKTSSTQAQINALVSGIMKSEAGLATALGGLVSGMSSGSSTAGGSPDSHFVQDSASGTSNTGQSYINGKPVSPSEFNTWLYGSGTTGNVSATQSGAATTQAADATANLIATFNAYGLGGEIASAIAGLVKKGYGADTISLIAQDPTSQDPVAVAYRTRFAGNAGRVAKGLAPLSPAEYLATENTYATLARQAGLPAGFYDNKDAWASLISNDVSASEVQSRVNLAKDVLINTDPSYLQQMQNYYGLDQSHALAHLLDPTAALPVIQKQVDAVKFGAAAARQGLGIDAATAAQYAGLGTTETQANQGFQNIANVLPTAQELAARYNPSTAGQQGANLVASTFGGTNAAQAAAELKRLQQAEVSQFSGSSGANSQAQSLGIGTAQGAT
jgi:hypothetical protein